MRQICYVLGSHPLILQCMAATLMSDEIVGYENCLIIECYIHNLFEFRALERIYYSSRNSVSFNKQSRSSRNLKIKHKKKSKKHFQPLTYAAGNLIAFSSSLRVDLTESPSWKSNLVLFPPFCEHFPDLAGKVTSGDERRSAD